MKRGSPHRLISGRPLPATTGRRVPHRKSFPGPLHGGTPRWPGQHLHRHQSDECPESLAGKLDWIHCFMPPWMHRQYAITPRKYLFARSDALLIDDLERNTQRFEQEGGHSILVPRPWNQLWGLDPFEAVEAQLKKFF